MAEVANAGADRQEISRSKLLLVEGENERRFFVALLRRLELSDAVQVLNYGGKTQLRPLLSTLHLVPGYSDLTALGVTRDADESFASAFQSICNSLGNAGLGVPDQTRAPTSATPSVSVFVLPDCSSPGMLETLCLSAMQDDPAMPCVEQYFQCLEESASIPSKNPDKARAHAFLASRSKPELRVGEAAEAGYWQLDSPVYYPLKSFLLAL